MFAYWPYMLVLLERGWFLLKRTLSGDSVFRTLHALNCLVQIAEVVAPERAVAVFATPFFFSCATPIDWSWPSYSLISAT
jgi:hypothetical protein